MITTVLAWLVKDPARIAGAAAIAALIALSGYLKVEGLAKDYALVVAAGKVEAAEKAAKAQDTLIGQLRQRVAADESTLTELARLGRLAAEQQEAANARAKTAAASASKAEAALKAAKVPADCDGAAAWARSASAELAKGWGK